jgi:hypothetical protein
MYKDMLDDFNYAKEVLSEQEFELLAQAQLEDMEKNAGFNPLKAFINGMKGVTNEAKVTRAAARNAKIREYVAKTHDKMRDMGKTIDNLTEQKGNLEKARNLWKGVGAAGAGVGVAGVGYGLKEKAKNQNQGYSQFPQYDPNMAQI